MACVLMFPGQGSQQSDMGELVRAHRPDLRELARALVGADPFDHLDEGTRFLQPAIFCASFTGAALLEAEPDYYAGHSLGEITALVAAESLTVVDGLRLVALRGRLMHEAALAGPRGGMLAVRMSWDAASGVARGLGLTLANDNSPEQVVPVGRFTAERGRTSPERPRA